VEAFFRSWPYIIEMLGSKLSDKFLRRRTLLTSGGYARLTNVGP
jgi:hypothetical protein